MTALSARGRAVRGWASGGSVYLGGMLNRCALGVAGIAAAHRFGIGPAQLSIFVVVQVGLYATMQIPTGVLVDRFGPRRLLLAASTVLGVSGIIFAFATNYPTALGARALLGCGDAMTYVSVLRYAANNFAPRRFPVVVALTSMFGFAGNLLATTPTAFLLQSEGWRTTFISTALLPLAGGIAVALFVAPPPSKDGEREPAGFVAAIGDGVSGVRTAWRTPGTRLGFWVHFACMSPATVFGLLWGLPYLVSIGFSQSAAGAVLLMCVLVGVVASLSIAALIALHPAWRVPIALGVCVSVVTSWTALLAAGGNHPPKPLVVFLVAVMAIGGPASAIGFVIARDYNLPAVVGTATGVVNCAGFFATIIGAAGVGLILDLVGNTGPGAFRLALSVAFALQAFGSVLAAVWWRRVRADNRRRTSPEPIVRVEPIAARQPTLVS